MKRTLNNQHYNAFMGDIFLTVYEINDRKLCYHRF